MWSAVTEHWAPSTASRIFIYVIFGASCTCRNARIPTASASFFSILFHQLKKHFGLFDETWLPYASMYIVDCGFAYHSVIRCMPMRSPTLHNTRYISQFKINYFAFVAAHRLSTIKCLVVATAPMCTALHLRFKCIRALWCFGPSLFGLYNFFVLIIHDYRFTCCINTHTHTCSHTGILFWWHKQMTNRSNWKLTFNFRCV